MVFREMRRKKQQLPLEECTAILDKSTSGVLALTGDGGYPYAVPLSYVRQGSKIFFHAATTGHKIDAIVRDNKASFCVIQQDQVIAEKYTSYFRSVIAFGRMRIVEEETEKRAAIQLLAVKYAPDDSEEHRRAAIEKDYPPLCILEMTIEHLTGKEGLELSKKRQSAE